MPPEDRIYLDQIAVENLGPLGSMTLKLGDFNLVFGRNESGKTYLVEFLLRSLFRYAGDWGLRSDIGQGKVRVRGLAAQAVEFSPSGRRKLEDYWSEDTSGLPTNLGRLLVVKGGELEFDRSLVAGVDRSVLKSVLSNENLLDRILKPMQETVKKARVVECEIVGHDKGELQDRARARADLERLDRLLEQVDTGVSMARIRSLELGLQEVSRAFAEQLEAKRHQAYRLHQTWKETSQALEALPQNELDRLGHMLRDLRRLDGDLLQAEVDLAARRAESQHYAWVEQAAAMWQEQRKPADPRLPWLILIGAGVVLGLAAGLALLNQSAAAAVAVVAGLGVGALGLWRLRQATAQSARQADRSELAQGFEQRFGAPLTDLAQLKTTEKELAKAAALGAGIEQAQARRRADRKTFAAELNRGLAALAGRPVESGDWEGALNELLTQRRRRSQELHELEKQLEGLGVDPSDYLERAPRVAYSKAEVARLERRLDDHQLELAEANQELAGLKQSLCIATGDRIDRPWEEILGNLWKLRQEKAEECRQRTARILAQIGVNTVLEHIAAAEDERIRQGLQHPAVRRALEQTTQHYRAVDLQDEILMVSSETADYDLADLSTGAREQVLLALRMGFASRLAGGRPMFMLLDDAFQHSDWGRRERLVAHVLSMVRSGWQVTYLTMDDHLRDLFHESAGKSLEDNYQLHVIGS